MTKKPKKSFFDKRRDKVMSIKNYSPVMAVYCITCTENGHRYIGSTSDLNKRWVVHQIDLISKKHHNPRLQKDFNSFGIAKFSVSILFSQKIDRLALYGKEQEFIDSLDPEYNIERVVVPWRMEQERLDKTKEAATVQTS